MKATAREELLKMLSTMPIIATRHAASLFRENGSPAKRASEALRELETEKLVESRRLGDMTRIWRLTNHGRLETATLRRSIPLNSPKTKHYLAIADWYVKLRDSGALRYFEVEPREPFKRAGKDLLYAPDALYIHDRSIFLCEMQLSRLSRKQWEKKWQRANVYFNERHFERASWQRFGKGEPLKPKFVCVSRQNPEDVRSGFAVAGRELQIVSEI